MTGRALLGLSLFLFMGLLPRPAGAAENFSLSPYLDYSYSSNIFWDSSAVSDAAVSPGVELNLAAGQFVFFLNADGKIYQSNDYLNRSMISGGFNFFAILSKRSSFFISPDVTLTRFQGEMSYLNTAIPSLVFGLKHVFSDRLYGRVGLSLRHSDYFDEDSYDRWRAAAFGEISLFFKSQTTLRLSLGLNYLYFPHFVMDAAEPAALAATGTTAAASPAAGSRRHLPGSSAPQPGPNVAVNTVELSFPQPYIVFRVAQGLGYQTGLIAEVQFRKNRDILENFDPLAVDEWALQQMDEDFFWQGTRLSLALKTEALLKLEIALDFSYLAKEYDGLSALDLNGDPVQPLAFRADTLAQVTMKIAKSLGHVAFYLTGSYRNNVSNDLYFRYDFYTISAGLDYAF
ncbi:MAG TPA: hypothetical protein VLQ89_05195 [Candidatus Binatia bacterium]|nr:hypothetical protein [Candidatus Binatia bacterium]